MEIRQLQYFIAIAEEKEITKAAQRLYISQPALTLYLGNLEKELGTKLFTRVHNKMELTYPGRRYLESAYHISSVYRETLNTISDYTDSKIGELRIATTPGRAKVSMPNIYPAFLQNYPNIQFLLTEDTAEGCMNRLISDRVDLIFIADTDVLFDKKQRSRCASQPLFHDEPILVTWRGNPAGAHARRVLGKPFPVARLTDFRKDRFILLPEGNSQTRYSTDMLFARENIIPNSILTLQNFSTIFSLLQNCRASTISSLVHYEPNNNLDYYTLEDPPTWDLSVIYRKEFVLTRYHQYCIDLMARDFERIRKQIAIW